jgi:hypothetical protein
MQAQLVGSRSCVRASALGRARPARSARLNVVNTAAVSTKSVSGRMAELKAQGKCVAVTLGWRSGAAAFSTLRHAAALRLFQPSLYWSWC